MSKKPRASHKKTSPAFRGDPMLARFVEELVRLHGCHSVILYGSRALGTATADSDYDLLGIRADGDPTRDARFVDGVFLDAFIYIEKDLEGAAHSMLQVRRGIPVWDPRGVGARLIADVEAALAKPPPPVPRAELEARRAWCLKMLGRVRRGGPEDVEAHYRRAWLLVDLLELHFVLRGRHFLGSKESLHFLELHDEAAYRAFAAALVPGAPVDAIEALVERVVSC
jgi:predicted nucleotidyltransferase